MLRLRRLKINKFRNVRPGCELRFHDGVNVLLGRNGTGKTTLLRLIVAALGWDQSGLANEDYDIEFELFEDSSSVTVTVHTGTKRGDRAHAIPGLPATTEPTIWADTSIRIADGPAYETRQNGATITGTLDGEVLGESEDYQGAPPLARALAASTLPAQEALNEVRGHLLANVLKAVRYDEALEVFYALVGEQSPDELASPQLLVSHSFDDDVELLRAAVGFHPWMLWVAVRARLQNEPSASTLRFEHGELVFLGHATELLGFESGAMELSLLKRETDDQGVERSTFGKYKFLFTRKGGRSTITHSMLSYGQKRMLGLLYYLDANPQHLIADELVNGLHHEWIAEIMEKLGERQAFLTSQNPLLLDYLEFADADAASRSFILCELDDDERMVWRNMNEDEARSFYSAYEVGIQHVGEILRSKGLW